MSVEIHHLAAVSGDLPRTIRFYHQVLGLKFILKPSLFDGPKVCHFYWDKEIKNFITFYHCPCLQKGKVGTNSIGSVSFSVPGEAMDFWEQRLKLYGIPCRVVVDEIEDTITFVLHDDDGLQLKLVFASTDQRLGMGGDAVRSDYAIKGLYGIEIIAKADTGLKALFTEQLRLRAQTLSKNRYRLCAAQKAGSVIDLQIGTIGSRAVNGCGMIHHLALKLQSWNHFMGLHNYLKHQDQSTFFKKHPNNFSAFYFRCEGQLLLEIVGQPSIMNNDSLPPKFEPAFFLKKQKSDTQFYTLRGQP